MLRFTHALFALIFAIVPASVVHADALDDYVLSQMKAFDLPGVAVAVLKDGKIVKISGYGLADVEHRVATTPDKVYKVGSVSKQFLASGIMLLAADGRLQVSDPLGKYLPDIPPSWQPITIYHLLTHTAGLIRESPAFDPMKVVPDIDVVRGTYTVPLRFVPGTRWEYSNTGYYALAAVITAVSGTSWQQFIQDRLFGPSGMTLTTPTNVSPTPGSRALGYTGRNNTLLANDWVALRPSGAYFSTLGDLAKWDALLYVDAILTEATRREMWTPVRLNDGTTYPYGYGWHTEFRNGRRVLWHGGGLPGYSSYFGRFVDDRVTVIVFANGDDGDLVAMGHGLAETYFAQAAGAAGATRR